MSKYIKKRIVICIIIVFFLGIMIFFLKQLNRIAFWQSTNNIRNESTNNIENEANKKNLYLSNSDLSYSSNREDYESDEQFSNFRLINAGNIKPIIYRGASPVYNAYNRAMITDKLLKEYNIKYIINLSNTENEFKNLIDKNMLSNSYTNSLYKQNKIFFGNVSIDYETQEYAKKVAESLMQIAKNEGPFYIHCTHGRDRTGMACIILEALADASYSEILNDYMKTYENYNNVNEENNPQKYKAIFNSRFKNAIYYITKDKNIGDYNLYDFKKAAKEFLEYGGLTKEEINELESSIKNEQIFH